MFINPENVLKIGTVYFEISAGYAKFGRVVPKVQMSHVIYGVTGPKLTKFLHDVETLLMLLRRTLT